MWCHAQSASTWNQFLHIALFTNCAAEIFRACFTFKRGLFETAALVSHGVMLTKILSQGDKNVMAAQCIIESMFSHMLPLVDDDGECLFGALYCLAHCQLVDAVCRMISVYGDVM